RRGRPGCGAAPARRGSPGRSRRDSPCCPPYGGLSDLNAFNFPDCRLYRVPGRFGDVLPPGRGDPAERPVGKLVDRPPGVLLEPVVASTFRAAITQARPPARFVRGVVVEVALGGGPAAARSGASRMPDPGQVPELDPGIMALGLEPVIALLRGDRVESDQQVRAASGDAKSPGAIPARRARLPDSGEGEPRPIPGPAWWRRSCPFPVAFGFWPGAAVADGVSLLVGHGDAPRGLRVGCGSVRQVPGQPRVDRPDPGNLSRPVGQPGHVGQRDGQGDSPGEPARRGPCRWAPGQPGAVLAGP